MNLAKVIQRARRAKPSALYQLAHPKGRKFPLRPGKIVVGPCPDEISQDTRFEST